MHLKKFRCIIEMFFSRMQIRVSELPLYRYREWERERAEQFVAAELCKLYIERLFKFQFFFHFFNFFFDCHMMFLHDFSLTHFACWNNKTHKFSACCPRFCCSSFSLLFRFAFFYRIFCIFIFFVFCFTVVFCIVFLSNVIIFICEIVFFFIYFYFCLCLLCACFCFFFFGIKRKEKGGVRGDTTAGTRQEICGVLYADIKNALKAQWSVISAYSICTRYQSEAGATTEGRAGRGVAKDKRVGSYCFSFSFSVWFFLKCALS